MQKPHKICEGTIGGTPAVTEQDDRQDYSRGYYIGDYNKLLVLQRPHAQKDVGTRKPKRSSGSYLQDESNFFSTYATCPIVERWMLGIIFYATTSDAVVAMMATTASEEMDVIAPIYFGMLSQLELASSNS